MPESNNTDTPSDVTTPATSTDPATPATQDQKEPLKDGDKPQEGNNLHVAFKAEIELLHRKVQGIIEKNANGLSLLVAPSNLGKANADEKVKLKKMLDEFEKAFNISDVSSIQDGLEAIQNSDAKQSKKVDLMETNVDLQSLYLYRGPDDSSQHTVTTEYAVSVEVELEEALPTMGFVSINKLFIQAWNIPDDKCQKIMPDTISIANARKKLFN